MKQTCCGKPACETPARAMCLLRRTIRVCLTRSRRTMMWLQCEVMSTNDPSQTLKQYTAAYKRPCKKEEAIDLNDGDEGAGPSHFAKHQQSSLTPCMPSAEKQAAVNKDLL
eukprot:1140332-Pelagomonas_calceolata.AAC.5